MVKAPSSHGLDRKYKPWRRGKSAKANSSTKSGASLKQQLRGLQRLYDKKSKEQVTNENGDESSNVELLKDLQSKIEVLQQQISSKNVSEKERANAKKSHKMRFVERQKTTRMYKQLQQQLQQKKSKSIENELYKLALDQVYVAHYPLEHSSYLSLYNNNERRSNMNRRLLYKMATQRQRVLERLSMVERVNWIPTEQYERVIDAVTATQKPCWSTELERTTFGITVTDGASGSSNKTPVSEKTDDRFAAVSDRAQKLVEEQEQIEKELAQDEEETEEAEKSTRTKRKQTDSDEDDDDDDDDGDESSSSDDDADPLVQSSVTDSAGKQSAAKTSDKDRERGDSNRDDSSDDSDNSQSNDEEKEDGKSGNPKIANTANKNDSDDDSTSSSSSSSSSSSDDRNESVPLVQTKNHPKSNANTQAKSTTTAPPSPRDDFLVAANDDGDVFANAKRHHPSMEDVKGDKSKGWATQRQFPGQFRKKQQRR